MNSFRKILASLTAAAILASCGHSAQEPDVPQAPDSGNYYYFSVRLTMSDITRAGDTPTPGENGDGLQTGSSAENYLHDICIFFYNDPDGLNASYPENVPVIGHCYIPGINDIMQSEGYVFRFKVEDSNYEPADGHRVAVAINMGDITSSVSTLADLIAYQVPKPWTSSASGKLSDFSRFTMASASALDGVVTVKGHEGTFSDPFRIGNIDVERTAARIDLLIDQRTYSQTGSGSDISASGNVDPSRGSLLYRSTVGSARVQISDVFVVNSLLNTTATNPWLLKRVSSSLSITAPAVVCGNEDVGANGLPSVYVLDPVSDQKLLLTADNVLEAWYGQSRASFVKSNYSSLFGSSTALAPFLKDISNFRPGELSNEVAMPIAYINENTHSAANEITTSFATALLVKAQYLPDRVYTFKNGSSEPVAKAYTPGQDLWRYIPATGDSVYTEADARYFLTEADLEKYAAIYSASKWMRTKYDGGKCYYTIWLMHANHKDHPERFAMKYATVRNNIYRVRMSFSGPGDPKPEFDEPEKLHATIFVRKWNLRRQETIVM